MRKVRYRTAPGTKQCPECMEIKPLSDFNGGYCSDCYREYHREWTGKNRNNVVGESLKQVVSHYGGKCTHCDETNPYVMKVFPTAGKGQRATIEFLKAHDFPEGYWLMCANCETSRKYK